MAAVRKGRVSPGTRPGRCPWTPPRAVALGTTHFGWVWEEGAYRDLARFVQALLPHCKGPRPLLGSRGKAPGGFEGRAHALDASPRSVTTRSANASLGGYNMSVRLVVSINAAPGKGAELAAAFR